MKRGRLSVPRNPVKKTRAIARHSTPETAVPRLASLRQFRQTTHATATNPAASQPRVVSGRRGARIQWSRFVYGVRSPSLAVVGGEDQAAGRPTTALSPAGTARPPG